MTIWLLRLHINDFVSDVDDECVCVCSLLWYGAGGFSSLILVCVCCFLKLTFLDEWRSAVFFLSNELLVRCFCDKNNVCFLSSLWRSRRETDPMLVGRIFDMFCFIECCSKYWIPHNITGTIVETFSLVTHGSFHFQRTQTTVGSATDRSTSSPQFDIDIHQFTHVVSQSIEVAGLVIARQYGHW